MVKMVKQSSILRKMNKIVNFIHPSTNEKVESPDKLATTAIRVGMWSFVMIFGIFGLWSAIAPLESAAIAVGSVVLDSNKKTVQHLEGGIVDQILVREGQMVKKGEVLVKLDETAATAQLNLLRTQSIAARATEARLLAERDNKAEVAFPEDLLAAEEQYKIVAENLDSQRRLFASRKKGVTGQLAILEQKVKQYAQEISGLNSQVRSASNQIGLLSQEIKTVKGLLAKGNASRPRLLALQRQAAALNGQRGEYKAQISRVKQSIAEAEIEKINLENQALNDVVAELKEVQVQVGDLSQRIKASSDTVNRIAIFAPISGTVTGLKVHTIGGVIAAGETVMDIIPQDDDLIIEARVNPQDIDLVRSGLIARVRLSAYKTRTVPLITGTVQHISADRFDDERTGVSYYLARITINAEEMAGLDGNVELYPGMPAEVLIVTGSRTFLSYLFTPISESFNRAFREQ